ncbi:hypothetical protein FGU32_24635 [Escherichia coli]|nr:hypothetical protein [Escherichia coli]
MTQQTELLDPMNVLSEVIHDVYSPDGGLVIVDEKWLHSDDLLSSLIVSSSASGELKIKEGVFLFDLPFKAKKLFPFLNLDWQEAHFYKMIAMATDALAKEVTNIPEVSQTGGRYTDKPLITLVETLDEWGVPAPQRTYAFGVDKDFYSAFEYGTNDYPLCHVVPSIEQDLKELQQLLEEMLPPLYAVTEIEDPFAL